MNIKLKLILSSFTRQKTEDDCGMACLTIIFKYSGLKTNNPGSHNGPLSIRQMQEIAKERGLRTRAVRMDVEHLVKVPSPCILHVLTEGLVPHFIIFYGYDPELELHLIGDPDKQVCYITESELLQRWPSRAAILFEDLPQRKDWSLRLYPWINLCQFDFVPGVLWLAIPLLNAFGTLLGLGATLIIEKAVSPQFLNGGTNLLLLVFTLLFSLGGAKCLINYFKQKLIINFAGKLDSQLFREFTSCMEVPRFSARFLTKRFTETIKDVQRIHQAASILIGGILCDGLMVIMMLVCLYFYFPGLVVLQAVIILVLIALTDRQLPFMLINYQSSQDMNLTIPQETASVRIATESLTNSGVEANLAYARKAERLSDNANKLNLYFDAITSIGMILVLVYTILQLRASAASYEEFIFGIILCYGTIATTTKICNQLFLVAHGADMLGRRIHNG